MLREIRIAAHILRIFASLHFIHAVGNRRPNKQANGRITSLPGKWLTANDVFRWRRGVKQQCSDTLYKIDEDLYGIPALQTVDKTIKTQTITLCREDG